MSDYSGAFTALKQRGLSTLKAMQTLNQIQWHARDNKGQRRELVLVGLTDIEAGRFLKKWSYA
jgi:hypothetical protein